MLLKWCMQRHVENVLYQRLDGGSTGALWKILNETGLSRTSLICNKASVQMGIITQAEMNEVLELFRQTSTRGIDPCSLGRVRSCTLLPIATVACICRCFGRSPASIALLRALAQPVPESWTLQEQQEALADEGEVDLLIDEQLEKAADFEAEDLSFAGLVAV